MVWLSVCLKGWGLAERHRPVVGGEPLTPQTLLGFGNIRCHSPWVYFYAAVIAPRQSLCQFQLLTTRRP